VKTIEKNIEVKFLFLRPFHPLIHS